MSPTNTVSLGTAYLTKSMSIKNKITVPFYVSSPKQPSSPLTLADVLHGPAYRAGIKIFQGYHADTVYY